MTDVVEDKIYNTASGFVLKITPLPPYYMDVIANIYPDKKYPKRIISNVAGDVLELYYEPEGEVDEEHEDYDLWLAWQSVDQFNNEQKEVRNSKREDFLLSMCVHILDGPISYDDDDWVHRVEASFQDVQWTVPTHPGERLLVFLKTVIITKPVEKEHIMNLAVYEEVSMGGIFHAMQGFQHNVGA